MSVASLKGLETIRYSSAADELFKTLEDVSTNKARSLRKLIGSATYDLITAAIEQQKVAALYKTVNLRTAIAMTLDAHKGKWLTNMQVVEHLHRVAKGRWLMDSICATLSTHKGCMWEWKNQHEGETWSEKVSAKVFRAKTACVQVPEV
jgi:hypothetical protein